MFNEHDMAEVLTDSLKTISETVDMLHDLNERIDEMIYDMGAGDVLEYRGHDLRTFHEVANTVAGTLHTLNKVARRTGRPELVTHTKDVWDYLEGEIITFTDMLKEHDMWNTFRGD